jgi:hypothetical protein
VNHLAEHDAATAIAKQQIELALREMLGEALPLGLLYPTWWSTRAGRRSGLINFLHGRFELDDALVERFLHEERAFALRTEGEPDPKGALVSMADLLAGNAEDKEFTDWLKTAPVDGCRMFGGGAAPTVYVRRVA